VTNINHPDTMFWFAVLS